MSIRNRGAVDAALVSRCSWGCWLAGVTQIHTTSHGWTAGNKVAFQGNVTHFADEQGVSRTFLLSLKESRGTYGGENQAQLQRWKISRFAIMDNASLLFEYNEEEQRLHCSGREFFFGEHPNLENLALRIYGRFRPESFEIFPGSDHWETPQHHNIDHEESEKSDDTLTSGFPDRLCN